MSFTLQLPRLRGFAVSPAVEGPPVSVVVQEFLTSEDGNTFVARLEALWGLVASHFEPQGIRPPFIDHLLVIIRPDLEATVYCNELNFECIARPRMVRDAGRTVGEIITEDDVLDIEQLIPQTTDGKPLTIPPECGVVFIFSHRWRRGVYYDFGVLDPNIGPRTENLNRLFGRFVTRLVFQELYSMSDAQWERLLHWRWFPFVGLTHAQRLQLARLANSTVDPHPFLEAMCLPATRGLAERMACWRRNELIAPHMPFLESALASFERGDFLPCLSVLLPRIEGVLRTLFLEERPTERAEQDEMACNLVENQYPHSILFPQHFDAFLRLSYFRNFNQREGDVELSRNSHGHGVSRAEDYDLVRATVAFLTLEQIVYYLED